MTREVQGLKWVRALSGRPTCIPQGRPRGAKADGVKYETALASGALKAASRGVWLEFADAAGHGYAQVDFLLAQSGAQVVFEAKLTWKPAAYVQLRRLYLPLLRALVPGVQVGGVVVCQNLTRETPRSEVCGDLAEAIARAASGEIPVLHLGLLAPARREPRKREPVPTWWRKGAPRVTLGAQ